MKWNNYKNKKPADGQWCLLRVNSYYSFGKFHLDDSFYGDYFDRDYDSEGWSKVQMSMECESYPDQDDIPKELLWVDGDEAMKELERGNP